MRIPNWIRREFESIRDDYMSEPGFYIVAVVTLLIIGIVIVSGS